MSAAGAPILPIAGFFFLLCVLISRYAGVSVGQGGPGGVETCHGPGGAKEYAEMSSRMDEYISQQTAMKEQNDKYTETIEALEKNMTALSTSLGASQEKLHVDLQPMQEKMSALTEVHESLKDSMTAIRLQVEEAGEKDWVQCESTGDGGDEDGDGSKSEGNAIDVSTLAALMDKLEQLEEMVEEINEASATGNREGREGDDDDDDYHDGNNEGKSCGVDKEDLESMVSRMCMDEASSILSSRTGDGVSPGLVSIENAIIKPDFAQRGAGASIVTGLTAPTYNPDKVPFRRLLQLVGYYTGYGFPEDAISVGASLGQCWPMEGRNGSIAIQLSGAVNIDAISIDHVSRHEALSMASAPKEFDVFFYEQEEDVESGGPGQYLLSGAYNDDGTSVQTYHVEGGPKRARAVRLQINDNYGNEDYTCLYRFRVHGQFAQ